jgi:hypothetical protein
MRHAIAAASMKQALMTLDALLLVRTPAAMLSRRQ